MTMPPLTDAELGWLDAWSRGDVAYGKRNSLPGDVQRVVAELRAARARIAALEAALGEIRSLALGRSSLDMLTRAPISALADNALAARGQAPTPSCLCPVGTANVSSGPCPVHDQTPAPVERPLTMHEYCAARMPDGDYVATVDFRYEAAEEWKPADHTWRFSRPFRLRVRGEPDERPPTVAVDRTFLIRLCSVTKHGPFGKGWPGTCDDSCIKCEAERILEADL